MRKHATLMAVAAAIGCTLAGSAAASVDDYATRYCQFGCDDPAAEGAAAASTWTALQAMGTTRYLGWEANGQVLDEAAMIAGARSMGASQFDQYLRTGAAPGGDGSEIEAAHARMAAVSGTDVSEIAGSHTQAAGAPAGRAATGIQGAAYCDPAVADLQVAAAEAKVDERVELAKSDVGYSTVGGQSVGAAGVGSALGSYANLSCLERLMNSGADVFFRPPTLGDLLGALEDFICNQAEGVFREATAPLNQSITRTADLGGFYPGLNLARLGGGVNMRVRPGMGGAGQVNVRGLPDGADGTVVQGGRVELPDGSGLSDLYK